MAGRRCGPLRSSVTRLLARLLISTTRAGAALLALQLDLRHLAASCVPGRSGEPDMWHMPRSTWKRSRPSRSSSTPSRVVRSSRCVRGPAPLAGPTLQCQSGLRPICCEWHPAVLIRSLSNPSSIFSSRLQGVAQLRQTLGVSEFEIDDTTLAWFLRDRKLDQEKAAKKARQPPIPPRTAPHSGRASRTSVTLIAPPRQVRAYLAWRAQGNDKLSYKDVQAEAATGKASLLSVRDVARPRPAARAPPPLERFVPAPHSPARRPSTSGPGQPPSLSPVALTLTLNHPP